MYKKTIFSIMIYLVALSLLSGCGDAPASGLPIGQTNDRDTTNVVIELPTQAAIASANIAEKVEQISDNEEALTELQVTVEALAETVANSNAAEAIPTMVEMVPEAAPTAVTEVVEAIPTAIPTIVEAAPTAIPTIVVTNKETLEQKFSSVMPDENGQVTVTVTQDEINRVLQSQPSLGNAPVSGMIILFTNGTIVFEADITQPREGRLIVTFVPYVSNNTLQFDVVEASLGGVRIPPAALSTAETTLNTTIGEAANQMPSHVTLTDIIIGEGYMTILGQIQN
ncbi:MAG: LmeA family phospholipid-binding protein [Chloroflexota bacterium]